MGKIRSALSSLRRPDRVLCRYCATKRRENVVVTMTGDNGVARIASSEVLPMKTIVFALVALSVLAGATAPAGAFDTKRFFEGLDRQSGGANGS